MLRNLLINDIEQPAMNFTYIIETNNYLHDIDT